MHIGDVNKLNELAGFSKVECKATGKKLSSHSYKLSFRPILFVLRVFGF